MRCIVASLGMLLSASVVQAQQCPPTAPTGATQSDPINLGTFCASGSEDLRGATLFADYDTRTCFTNDFDENLNFQCYNGSSEDDVWIRFELTAQTTLSIAACAYNGAGARIHLLQGNTIGTGWSYINYIYNPGSCPSYQGTQQAGVYFLVFEHAANAYGYSQTTVNVTANAGIHSVPSPPGADFWTAVAIPDPLQCGTVLQETRTTEPCFRDDDADGKVDYYYSFTPVAPTYVQVTATATGFTPTVSILNNSGYSPVTANTLDQAGTTAANLVAGQKYYFCIEDGGWGAHGAITTSIASTITQHPPTVTVTATALTVFAGESVTLSAQGACSYTWSPAIGLNATTGPTVIATPPFTTTYLVTGFASTGGTATATVSIAVDNRLNRVITRAAKVPGIKTLDDLQQQSIQEVAVHTTYYDGIGRVMQEVDKQSSPEWQDQVAPIKYDEMGRQAKRYLPYSGGAMGQGSDGGYQADALQTQAAFYGAAGDRVANDASPWAMTQFEEAELNRPVEHGAPGTAWQPGAHTQHVRYRTNETNEVVRFTTQQVGSPSQTNPYYQPGSLSVQQTTAENGAVTLSYTDRAGRRVLVKQQQDASVTDPAAFAATYYVYDDFGNQSMVIQPAGVAELLTAGSYTMSPGFIDKWCFTFEYDSRQRLIHKYIPGGGSTWYVYNQRNLPILVGDAVGTWTFTKYDSYGRVIMTGLYPAAAGKSQSYLQDQADGTNILPYENTIESPTTSGQLAYTLTQSFPTLIVESDVLTRTFYDRYEYEPLTGRDFLPFEIDAPLISKESDQRDFYVTYDDLATRTVGLVTGQQERVLGTSDWLTTSIWYDADGRTIQTLADIPNGGPERTTLLLDFTGQVLATGVSHSFQDGVRQHWLYQENHYDHSGRLVRVDMKVDQRPKIQLANYGYNELGQLVDKQLHSVNRGLNSLQSVDYRYNIRGWLTHVNNRDLSNDSELEAGVDPNTDNLQREQPDLFGLELKYNTGLLLPSNSGSKPQYGGNISEMHWHTGNPDTGEKLRAYAYAYDAANRIKGAQFREWDPNTWSWIEPSVTYSVNNVTYDANGNLQTMTRHGDTEHPWESLDQFQYSYTGNQLIAVDDWAGSTPLALHDFEDNGNIYAQSRLQEYSYDLAGRLTADVNKGLTSITYNHLQQPVEVAFAANATRPGSATLTTYYTGSGRKLRTVTNGPSVDGQPQARETIYAGSAGFVYEDAGFGSGPELQFVPTPEGRLVYDAKATEENKRWVYEYHMKDHLGNLRFAFREEGLKKGEWNDSFEPSQRPGGGEKNIAVAGVAETRRRLPVRARTGEHVVVLGGVGTHARQIGPTVHLAVTAGDSIYASVWGSFEVPARLGLGKVLAGLTGTMQGVPVAENRTSSTQKAVARRWQPRLGINLTGLIGLTAGANTTSTGTPAAYMKVGLYDSDSALVVEVRKYLNDSVVAGEWQELQADLYAEENGYIKVELVDDSPKETYFDDLSLRLIDTKNFQENNYDPFGQNLVGIETTGNPDHHWQFNGKEKQDQFGLYWSDYGARSYDLQIGRWTTTDPLASQYFSASPYNYVGNNPVNAIDPDGRKIIFVNGLIKLFDIIPMGAPPAGYPYWNQRYTEFSTDFVDAAKNSFGDHRSFYATYEPSSLSSTTDRFEQGREYVTQHYESIVAGMDKKETFKFVAHSMGTAFAEGMIAELKARGWSTEKAVYINTFQASDINLGPDAQVVDYQNVDDPVLRIRAGGDIPGADKKIRVKTHKGYVDVLANTRTIHREFMSDPENFWKLVEAAMKSDENTIINVVD